MLFGRPDVSGFIFSCSSKKGLLIWLSERVTFPEPGGQIFKAYLPKIALKENGLSRGSW